MFEAPIPGQSLTTAPKQFAYERPPEINDPEDAIRMHLERLNKADKLEAILDTLEMGVTVKELTTGLLRSAVGEGIHSIDVSLLISPVIHEFIKSTADEANITYEEGLVDKEELRRKEGSIIAAKARRATPISDEVETVEEEPVVEESEGFLKRRT